MNIDFETLFARSPNPYVVLDPALTIVWMNAAYLRVTMRTREDILGRAMFEAFPSEPGSESHELLRASLSRVLADRQQDEIALIRYDIPAPDGSMDIRYWSATNLPVLDESGAVAFILQHTVDVTELQTLRRLRDEMGVVQRASAVQARNRDLSVESERLRQLLEQAPGFVAVLAGSDHVFTMANKAYRSLVGERELAGKPLALALPEIVDQGFLDLLNRVREKAEPYVGRREKVLLQNEPGERADERYLDFLYQPILSESGEVSGVFVQGHDVTEQVEAEDHQKLLINELNHRVKNSLAIVQSLALQSFRKATSVESGLLAFTARLAALSSAHSLLTRGNWEAASLIDVLRASIEALVGPELPRVYLSGPIVELSPQVATAAAMLAHELATNALKYGSLSAPAGRIEISWDVGSQADNRQFTFAWIERGGPKISMPIDRGFGTRLIQRGFATDKQASVDLRFEEAGFECHIVTLLPETM